MSDELDNLIAMSVGRLCSEFIDSGLDVYLDAQVVRFRKNQDGLEAVTGSATEEMRSFYSNSSYGSALRGLRAIRLGLAIYSGHRGLKVTIPPGLSIAFRSFNCFQVF